MHRKRNQELHHKIVTNALFATMQLIHLEPLLFTAKR